MNDDPVHLFNGLFDGLFDGLAAAQRDGGEMDDGEVEDFAKELGGETGVVVKQVTAWLEGQGEAGKGGEEAAVITVNENVGDDGEVVGGEGGDLGGDVGRDGAAFGLTEEGEDLGTNIDAIEAGIGAEQGEESIYLGLGEGSVVGEAFPAGDIEAWADEEGASRSWPQMGPSGVERGGIGRGGVAAEASALVERV